MSNTEREIEDIELEILELNDRYKNSRNTAEKGYLSSKMDTLRREIRKIKDSKVEIKSTIINDAPARIDHVDDNSTIERKITDAGNIFASLE